jgi:Flp pilus assembly protein TadG
MGRQERGSNLVEVALVLPVLLLLLAGVADVGRAFGEYIVLTGAAREGARYGAYFPSQQTLIQDRTLAMAADAGVSLVRSNITVTRIPGAGSDEAIRVAVAHPVNMLLGSVVGLDTLIVRSYAEMPVLDPDR